MTKLTTNQQATIVRLFLCGTSTDDLAHSYQVHKLKIEEILRKALLGQGESFTR